MNFGSIFDNSLHLVHVVLVDSLRVSEVLGHIDGYDNLVDCAVGVRRDHSTTCEVDTLGGKVQTEATLLSLETSAEGADGFVP